MPNHRKDIIASINQISGKYSAYEVFTDWIRCMALSISNTCDMKRDKVWEDREQAYKDTMRKYSLEERKKLCEMMVWLAETLDDGIEDVLGDIYMKSGMGSKAAGQFFTPTPAAENEDYSTISTTQFYRVASEVINLADFDEAARRINRRK